MESGLNELKCKLLSHLGKREKFNAEKTHTLICPYPVSIIGEPFYSHSIKASAGCYSCFTFFDNGTSDIKLYSMDIPGIYRIRTGSIYYRKNDNLAHYAGEAAGWFKENHTLNSGITGVISLPFSENIIPNEFQIKVSVLCGLHLVNNNLPSYSVPPDKPVPGTGYDSILDPAEYLTVLNGHADCLVSINKCTPEIVIRNEDTDHDQLCLIVAVTGNSEAVLNRNRENVNYDKVLTLLKTMAGLKDTQGLEDIPVPEFGKYARRFPHDLRSLAMHYYNDTRLIDKAVSGWKRNDIIKFGEILSTSSVSKCNAVYGVDISSVIREVDSLEGAFGTAVELKKDFLQINVLAKTMFSGNITNSIRNAIEPLSRKSPEIRIAKIGGSIKTI